MDLGITGRWAILMGSTRGLGRACAESVCREGVNVVVNGRDADGVARTVAELTAAHSSQVVGVVGDTTLPETQHKLLEACDSPDIVLLNGQGPPPKSFADIERDDWEAAVTQNLVAPLEFLKMVIPGMKERGFGRIVAVSSAMVKSPHSFMSLSHGTRLGLTGVLKGLSKDLAKFNVTVNQLLPERFDTARQEQMAKVAMKMRGITYDEARAEQVKSIKAGRLGLPHEFGDAFAFLCSAQAGFISGQSVQLDGGSYEGVF